MEDGVLCQCNTWKDLEKKNQPKKVLLKINGGVSSGIVP